MEFAQHLGLRAEAMPVIRFRAELYPSSVGAQRMLAEDYIDSRDYPAAVEVYSALYGLLYQIVLAGHGVEPRASGSLSRGHQASSRFPEETN